MLDILLILQLHENWCEKRIQECLPIKIVAQIPNRFLLLMSYMFVVQV